MTRRIALVVALQATLAPVFAGPAHAAGQVFTVTSAADTAGPCTSTSCTLRSAITAANSSVGGAVINFNIAPSGPKTITVGTGADNALPAITGSDVVMDATTQPGGGPAGIRLDDPDTGDAESGLEVQGQRVTIRGFAITRFDGYGILVSPTAREGVIVGNRIGTVDGTTRLGPAWDGIHVRRGGGHRIGGTTAADRNLVSGAFNDGIEIEDSSDNVVTGNYVGVTADGLSRLPNNDTGIEINGVSLRNRVGGPTAAERNVVSGNDGIGIQLLGSMRTDGTCESPEQNLVEGNYAGVNAIGAKPSPWGNHGAGIELGVCARNNTVGGSAAGAGNVASGNHDDGIQLDGKGGPGGTGAVCGNRIEGNIVGLDPTGRAARPNVDDGIDLDRGACGNDVVDNLVSGNDNDGIDLHEQNANGAKTSANRVVGNTVGLAGDGLTAQKNLQHGVHIRFGSTNNRVEENVVAGNGMSGVAIETSLATGNTVANNTIGLAADGTTVRGNAGYGVWLANGTRLNTVSGNTIAGNASAGIVIDPQTSTTPTDANRISRNRMRGNGGLGIDLLPVVGVNPNDGALSATVGNAGLDFPVVQQASTASVKGTAPAGATVELFIAAAGAGETHGEGATYLGTVAADGAGAWCIGNLTVTGSVTATATDAKGNTSEFAANVAAAGTQNFCQGTSIVVSDTFSRTVTGAWGSTGPYNWSVTGTTADYSVDGSVGAIGQSATGTRTATLAIGRQNVAVKTRFRFVSVPSSSWQGVQVMARIASAGDWYCARVRSVAGAADDIEIDRSTTAGGIARVGTGAVVPEIVAGKWYWLALEVTGDGATTSLRTRLWADGTAEPSGWNVVASDATTALQGSGGAGIRVSSSSTSSPARVDVDDFTVSATG